MEVGTDIIEVARVGRAIEKKRFFERVFTAGERERAAKMSGERRKQHFAGLFAAKEAAVKAMGDVRSAALTIYNCEIVHDQNGKPFIAGREDLKVSISHTREYAVAVVIRS